MTTNSSTSIPPPILENHDRSHYKGRVIIDATRTLNRAVPFAPYEIRMASGERHVIPHFDFIMAPPKGNYVTISDEAGHLHILNAFLIEKVMPVESPQESS